MKARLLAKLGDVTKTTHLRYLLVGGFAYLAELVTLATVHYALGLGDMVSVSVGFWTGVLVSFAAQKVLAFGDRRWARRVVEAQAAMFVLLVVFNYVFTLAMTELFTPELPVVLVRAVVLIFTTAWNYYLYKNKIFNPLRKKRPVRRHGKKRRRQMRHKGLVSRVGASASALQSRLCRAEYGRLYSTFSLVVLAVSTTFWSVLGAQMHMQNADQLVDPYMMESWATFSQSTFPAAHTYLFKWPVFWAVEALGGTPRVFELFTVGVSLATVGAFAYLLCRIERRPMVLATLYIIMSAALFLVPILPAPGALLPVGMAMLTTRNLEYVVYILALWLVIGAAGWRNWRWATGVVLLAILMASDRLFVLISLGGALTAAVAYGIFRNQAMVKLARSWLAAGSAATLGSWAVLAVMNLLGITNIGGESTPFGLVSSAKNLALGLWYAAMSLMTNFGANPAFDATEVGQTLPRALWHLRDSSLALRLVCLVLFVGVVVVSIGTVIGSLRSSRQDVKARLAVGLVWSTVAAVVVFVLSEHYYPVDARYLSIAFFAGFVALAVWVRRFKPPEWLLLATGLMVTVAMISATRSVVDVYYEQRDGLRDQMSRNLSVSDALSHHPVDVLVGDYWRVVPIRAMSQQAVMPLDGCLSPRTALSSKNWQVDLAKHSFAYLLTLEQSQTGYPACSFGEVTAKYGEPSATAVLAGSIQKPREMLLFYKNGASPHRASTKLTFGPLLPKHLPQRSCEEGSIVQIVAHPDDDLLFMSPDLVGALRSGKCVRTVYMTAGDAGGSDFYWLERERGVQAAYDSMLGVENGSWGQSIVDFGNKHYAKVMSSQHNPNVSLIFMNLPDGNMHGEGFRRSHYESLAALQSGEIGAIHTVDGLSAYSSGQLVAAMEQIVQAYRPTEVRSQIFNQAFKAADHSDHEVVGRMVHEMLQRRTVATGEAMATAYYMGYPVRLEAASEITPEYEAKIAAFLRYAKFDGAVCRTFESCMRDPAYGAYLMRQHRVAE